MPLIHKCEKNRCSWQWGPHGKRYWYTTKEKEAKKKAIDQALAILYSIGRRRGMSETEIEAEIHSALKSEEVFAGIKTEDGKHYACNPIANRKLYCHYIKAPPTNILEFF